MSLEKDKEQKNLFQPARKPYVPIDVPQDDESNWLMSYADMMTLLCGFFILLFSMSKMDEPKFENFRELVAKQFGVEYISPPKDLAKEITTSLKQQMAEKIPEIKVEPFGVSVIFQSTMFFDTLSADVTPPGLLLLNKLIDDIIKQQKLNSKIYKIIVEGHTDGRPVVGGPYPSNWELSSARASRVIRMFIEHGFSAKNLIAIGYADTHSLLNSRNPDGTWNSEAMARNRRVILRILEPSVESIPFEGHSIQPEKTTH